MVYRVSPFDTTIAHADDVLSFMASMGVVIIVAF